MKAPKRFVGAQFVEKTVHLDGREFEGCNFERCILIYSGGESFILAGCRLDGCNIAFEGAARRTLEQLSAMHNFGYAEWVEEIFQRVRKPFEGTQMQ